MKIVVDTDVIAAALLGEPDRHMDAERVLAGHFECHAPSHWKAEFANVLWKAVRLSRVSSTHVEDVLSTAAGLRIVTTEVDTLWCGAVVRALGTVHPVYDTLFVELAERLGTFVVSFDQALARRFPSLVTSPPRFLQHESP